MYTYERIFYRDVRCVQIVCQQDSISPVGFTERKAERWSNDMVRLWGGSIDMGV